jgi:hypothetical protein
MKNYPDTPRTDGRAFTIVSRDYKSAQVNKCKDRIATFGGELQLIGCSAVQRSAMSSAMAASGTPRQSWRFMVEMA